MKKKDIAYIKRLLNIAVIIAIERHLPNFFSVIFSSFVKNTEINIKLTNN